VSFPAQFNHIKWSKINFSAQKKSRANPGFRFPPRMEPIPQHGQKLSDQSDQLLNKIQGARNSIGVDPSKLVVMDFNFIEMGQREHLERLSIDVLEEKEQRIPLPIPVYNVNVKFDRPEHLLNFIETTASQTEGVTKHDRIRKSNGEIDLQRITLSFESREQAKEFIRLAPNVDGLEVNDTPVKKNYDTVVRVLGQFPDLNAIQKFKNELVTYRSAISTKEVLTHIQRRSLFDALESMGNLDPEERIGSRLRKDGFPSEDTETYFDVDLWYPGPALLLEARAQFKVLVESAGGRITDQLTTVANSMLLARVHGTRRLLDALIAYDRVALVDMPPQQPLYESTIFNHPDLPVLSTVIEPDGPLACIVDSGVVAAHPLLKNVVLDSRDFDSGENTPVDKVGHGTHCAGVVVYGDVSSCLQSNIWIPKVRLLSAKVMRLSLNGSAEFGDDSRVETQVRNAITTFTTEYNCRIYNLSFGHLNRPYTGGRQLPWAQMIDELCKSLDIVCIISAGNVRSPTVPEGLAFEDFQLAVRDGLLSEDHSIIDPATSMLSLTVGSLAKSDRSFSNNTQNRRDLAAAPIDAPSPFTRSGTIASDGPAPKRAIKPELAAYGGNYILGTLNNWQRVDPGIGVPSLNFDYHTRALSTTSGTSIAAPYVTHCCALIETALRRQGLLKPSANLIRALVVHGAKVPLATSDWICKNIVSQSQRLENTLRLVGYGMPSQERSSYSTDNRVMLYSEDSIQETHFQLYELEIPEDFINKSGDRSLRITLAYDPPVRGTRREYLGRTMSFQVYRGVPADLITRAMSAAVATGARPKIEDKYSLKCEPTHTHLEWSTVQSAVFETNRSDVFHNYRVGPENVALIHILVSCKHKFPCDATINQKYAIVASLEHSDETIRLHNVVRSKVELRNRVHQPR
jgi:hypothetical protein